MRHLGWLLALVAVAGAVLFEHYALTRQRLQGRVDVAAAQGAKGLLRGKDVGEAVRTSLRKSGAVRPNDSVEIQSPPREGRFRGWTRAVRVRIRRDWAPPLVPPSVGPGVKLDVRVTVVAVPPAAGRRSWAVLRAE